MSYTELSRSIRTAHKEHRCIWCPEKILPGEKYEHVVSVYDGQWQHHDFHPECAKAAGVVARDEGGECEIHPHECQRGTGAEVTREYLESKGFLKPNPQLTT
jgi:hypothetical protein